MLLAAPVGGESIARPLVEEIRAADPARASVRAEEPITSTASTWRFTIEPYLWLAGIDGDGGTDDTPIVPIDVSPALDSAFLLAFEARPQSGIGIVADGLYLRLADDDGSVRTTVQATMAEIGGTWPLTESRSLEAIGGVRYVGLGLDVDVTSVASGNADKEWVDPWIGARGGIHLGETWSIAARGDVGGFGVGSDFTWQGAAAVRADLSEHVRLDLGYRALSIDFDDGDLEFDAIVHGPYLGLALKW